ncbi:MAG: tetratricopeptide repeat protein, partial [Candidatus Rokuibacteriota bacterium]
MSATLARLRKRAAEFEQKKQFDRALEVYVQILDEGGKELEDEDVPLFNRVGDMLMRQGSVTEALGYYERAVDMYAERGYLNNAIALCSKILRQSPGRAAVYYKLARISARKGFKSDARKNFLEYADRMQKLGMADEAFRALKEFASLYPDQDDVRLVLAELLSKENRKGEAIEQLQSLYDKLQSEGRAAEARATIDRMRAIDPSVTPREGGESQPAAPVGDLIFLDLSDADVPNAAKTHTPQPVSARAPMPTPVPALTGLSITFFPGEAEAAPRPEGFESTAVDQGTVETTPVERSLTPLGSELVVGPPTSPPSVPKLEEVARFEMIEGEPAASAPSRSDDVIEDFLPEPPIAPPADDELETATGLQTPMSG